MTGLSRLRMTVEELHSLAEKAEVICLNRQNFLKVGYDSARNIIKTFDLTREGFLHNYFFSDGKNFIRNAACLKKKGIKTIEPLTWFWCSQKKYEVVTYTPLPGKTIYETIRDEKDWSIMPSFASYVAFLHQKKIYFRAGHADNYLVQPNKQFALIDVDNTRFVISLRRRAKNLAYIVDHANRNFRELFQRYSFSEFMETYLEAAKINKIKKKVVLFWVHKYLKKQGCLSYLT